MLQGIQDWCGLEATGQLRYEDPDSICTIKLEGKQIVRLTRPSDPVSSNISLAIWEDSRASSFILQLPLKTMAFVCPGTLEKSVHSPLVLTIPPATVTSARCRDSLLPCLHLSCCSLGGLLFCRISSAFDFNSRRIVYKQADSVCPWRW